MKNIKILFFTLSTLWLITSCERTKEKDPEPIEIPPSSEIALKWGKMTLRVMYKQAGNSPVYGSRALGYMGLTMYESVVQGSKTHNSIANQLNTPLFVPKIEIGKKYIWNLALNAGQAAMLRKVFYFAPKVKQDLIDSLERAVKEEYSIGVTDTTITARSINYGKEVANAIYEYSKTDGGFEGNKRNFDASYEFPSGRQYWIPPLSGQVVSPYPLQPYWGKNRTFSPLNADLPIPDFMTYSRDTSSIFYKEFFAVYKKRISLTPEEREIAAWWADDPTETYSPPGHSYSIANIVLENEKPNIYFAAEAYARIGLGVTDAFINCWKAKYKYHALRPLGYIFNEINSIYTPFWPEPPFPAFYSGHAVQGSTAATVLEDLFGKSYQFIDVTHKNRPKDLDRNIEYKPRSFSSFRQMSDESAYSRFLGGIHTNLDNEVGKAEGLKIGGNINMLQWRKPIM